MGKTVASIHFDLPTSLGKSASTPYLFEYISKYSAKSRFSSIPRTTMVTFLVSFAFQNLRLLVKGITYKVRPPLVNIWTRIQKRSWLQRQGLWERRSEFMLKLALWMQRLLTSFSTKPIRYFIMHNLILTPWEKFLVSFFDILPLTKSTVLWD